ncbi:MAG: phage tail protein [Ferruginibacter sp.]
MTDNQNKYPSAGFYFKVQVEGINEDQEARFQYVSGLDVKIETEAIQEGGENRFSRKLPKALQYSNLVLKRGLLVGSPFMTWINKAVQNFTFEPKMVHVLLMNENGEPLVNWTFHNAYPVAVHVSDLNATENSYAIETLELAYDYYERTDKL